MLAIMTGHNSFDNEVWIVKLVEFVKSVLAQDRVRLIGICFGHQIIGRALEQKVGRSDRGWEVSVTPMQLTAKGKELFGVEELVSPLNIYTRVVHKVISITLLTIPLPPGHSPNAPRRGLHLASLRGAPWPLAAM
jgi:GMP synthase-like glutamine amidotransferase